MSAVVNNPGNLVNRKVVQDNTDNIVERLSFDTGAILYIKDQKLRSEQTVYCNFEIKRNSDGSHSIDFNKPNQEFIDWG